MNIFEGITFDGFLAIAKAMRGSKNSAEFYAAPKKLCQERYVYASFCCAIWSSATASFWIGELITLTNIA